MFFVIGLGLCDEKDVTLRGLEVRAHQTRIYTEAKTPVLGYSKFIAGLSRSVHKYSYDPTGTSGYFKKEAFYGKPLILADRDMVETQSDEILKHADKEDVSLLVVGDPFGATTHTDIILRARTLGIPTRVIHNASIMNAVGACGLQLYNFGQTVSLVFFTETWKPDSFYDKIKQNADLGMHTLLLLDIKVKEQSEENLARGKKIYEPPRYMSIPLAISQLIETEQSKQSGTLSPNSTLAIALSRIGGGDNHQRIISGTLTELSQQPPEIFGEPLHSLVIVGKRLHHLEVDYALDFAVNKGNWKKVAKEVYGCVLDDD